MHPKRVHVWCGFRAGGITGPYFTKMGLDTQIPLQALDVGRLWQGSFRLNWMVFLRHPLGAQSVGSSYHPPPGGTSSSSDSPCTLQRFTGQGPSVSALVYYCESCPSIITGFWIVCIEFYREQRISWDRKGPSYFNKLEERLLRCLNPLQLIDRQQQQSN